MRDPQNSARTEGVSGARPILIVGLDGVRWDRVEASDGATFLRSLAADGQFVEMTMETPTISAPGWGSLLTGALHAEHGVVDNSMVGSNLWRYPDVLSLAFFRDVTTRTFASAGWPVLVDPQGLGPIIHPRVDQQKAGLHRVIARDGETNGYPAVDAECVDYAHAALRGAGFDVGFVYCCDVDDAGHVYGALSDEYSAAIARVNSHVKRLAEDLQFRFEKFDEDWLLCITTDHGHVDEGGHGGDSALERASWAITWAPSGNVPSWAPHIAPTDLTPLLLDARYAGGCEQSG